MCGFAGFFNADARDMVCRALACPEPVEGLAMTTSPRHCEERSDVAIHLFMSKDGLLRIRSQ